MCQLIYEINICNLIFVQREAVEKGSLHDAQFFFLRKMGCDKDITVPPYMYCGHLLSDSKCFEQVCSDIYLICIDRKCLSMILRASMHGSFFSYLYERRMSSLSFLGLDQMILRYIFEYST